MRLAATAVVVALALGATGFELYFSSSGGSPSTTTQASTSGSQGLGTTSSSTMVSSASSTTSMTSVSQGPTTTSTTGAGLQLRVSLNGTTLHPGNTVTIAVAEYNAATTVTNVSRASSWPIGTLALGPCGTSGFPIGIAVFQGHYTSANASSAAPLRIFKPTAPCPAAVASPAWFAFQSQSSLATTAVNSAPMMIQATLIVNGTWRGGDIAGNGATLSSFSPGVYTVAGGDEWGGLVLQYFSILTV
jgi:hypothetical protein